MKRDDSKGKAWLAGMIVLLIIACGLLLPVLLLNKQKMELERQREYVTYAQVQPLYFGKDEHFSHREPEKEEMTLTEADFIARKKLQEYFAMEILQTPQDWPLNMEDAQLATDGKVWRLLYGVDQVAWLEVRLDSIRGTIYLIGYLEQQSDCEKDVKGMPSGEPQNDISVKEEERNLSDTEADVLRMAQQMALEYQEEDGELLDHKGDDYAAVALKDGHIAVACWGNNPWWQYMAVVEAQTYQEDNTGGGWLWKEEALIRIGYEPEHAEIRQ